MLRLMLCSLLSTAIVFLLGISFQRAQAADAGTPEAKKADKPSAAATESTPAAAAEAKPSKAAKPSAEVDAQGWQPNPELQARYEAKRKGVLVREEGVPSYTLPEALRCEDGTPVTTVAQWEAKRRGELLDLFSKYVYGRTPPKSAKVSFEVLETDPKAMDGRATMKRVRITSADAGKSYAFEAAVLIPNQRSGPVPAFLLINNRSVASADPSRAATDGFWPAERIIERGYATAVFRTNDVDSDEKAEASRARGVRGVWPAGGGTIGEDAWATIGAWAWGASRVLDYLETEPAIDAKKVAVIGHSRGGKTALWAGVQDERFAIAISNNSGCGGAALSRRRFGETVAAINRGFPYWFCQNFKKFDGREDELPIDQHELIALIAPRGVCVASADADFWADQRGEFLAMANASPVYALYGLEGMEPDEMPPLESPLVRGHMSYHIRPGGHGLEPYDWEQYMNFADGLWGRKP